MVEGQELKRLWNELGTNVSGTVLPRNKSIFAYFIFFLIDLRKFRPVFTVNEFLGKIFFHTNY